MGVQEVHVAVVGRSWTLGSMVWLKAFPPTIWCRWGDGFAPGLTRLDEWYTC